jgi:hypothetical protein
MKTAEKKKIPGDKKSGKNPPSNPTLNSNVKKKASGDQLVKDEPEQDSAKKRVHDDQKDKRQNSGKVVQREPTSQISNLNETRQNDIKQTDINPNVLPEKGKLKPTD